MKFTRAAFIVNAFFFLLSLLIGLTSGLGGVLLFGGLYAFVLFLVALITGRGSWLGLASRKASAVAAVAAFGVTVAGGAVIAESAPAPTVEAQAEQHAKAVATPAVDLDNVEDDLDEDGERITDFSADSPAVYSASGRTDTTTATALQVLETLSVKDKASDSGYSRESFGTEWQDLDADGCNSRNDILNRDLSDVYVNGSCAVESGTLADPYTGARITFVRGESTSAAVQVDHLVAPAHAWRTGATELTERQLIELANDPVNLLAVDGPTRESRGSSDAGDWLPPSKEFRCEYVARQVSVKASYDLWVSQPEKDSIIGVLGSCPQQKAYRSSLNPLSEPSQEPSPTTVPATTSTPSPTTEAPRQPDPEPTTAPPTSTPAEPSPEEEEETGQRTGITPGAWCKKAEVGDLATGKNGKTYRCEAEGNKGRWKPV